MSSVEEVMDKIKERIKINMSNAGRGSQPIFSNIKVGTAKKIKTIIAIAVPIFVVFIVVIITILMSKVIVPNSKYKSALNLYETKKYEEAYNAFSALDYKDSAEKAEECLFFKQKAGLTNVTVGSIIKFGSYEQDNKMSNGKEEIEWIVLAVEQNKALILSQYALDCKKYDDTHSKGLWETCSLREWLNGEFYNEAFDSRYHSMIVSSTVIPDKGTFCEIPGNNTTDNIFILNATEIHEYFGFNERMTKCAPTEYAIAQGAYTSNDSPECWWWLRTPSGVEGIVECVAPRGSVEDLYTHVDDTDVAVRPAMWINLKSSDENKNAEMTLDTTESSDDSETAVAPTEVATETSETASIISEAQDDYKELDLSKFVGEWSDATCSTYASISNNNGKLYIVISSVMEMGREQWSWEYDDCEVMDGEGIEASGTYMYLSYDDEIEDWAIMDDYQTTALLGINNGVLLWSDESSGWSCEFYRQ